jgi:hypothetical protein
MELLLVQQEAYQEEQQA